MSKKIMLLGGIRYLLPVIKAAKALGYYVITCDYIQDNIAHKYSDEYHNVSIIDKDAILELAQKLKIDGIMSFAVDPGVLTAAYVADKMKLPTPPYESVKILQNKGLFREFLKQNKFNVPIANSFKSQDEVNDKIIEYTFPVIVKPVDSAGSKGVTKVDQPNKLNNAINIALKFSLNKEFIIEEFIEPLGNPTDCDSFSIDSQMVITTFNNQYFDAHASNPYTPAGYSWPSTMIQEHQTILKNEIQRLVSLLNMSSSIYNIETRVGKNGTPYIMELSPRGGGNRLSEMVKLVYGIDLIEMAIKSAMGETLKEYKEIKTELSANPITELILHADAQGTFESIEISDNIKNNLIEMDLWVNKGDVINSFSGANDAIGTLVVKDIVTSLNENTQYSNEKEYHILVN